MAWFQFCRKTKLPIHSKESWRSTKNSLYNHLHRSNCSCKNRLCFLSQPKSEHKRFSFLHTSTVPFLVHSLKRKFSGNQDRFMGKFAMVSKLFSRFLRRGLDFCDKTICEGARSDRRPAFIPPQSGWSCPLVQATIGPTDRFSPYYTKVACLVEDVTTPSPKGEGF